MKIQEIGFSEWDTVLPTTGITVFHTAAALRVLDRHAVGELRLLGGFKGSQPVGLIPVFVRDKSVAKFVFSPPLGFGIRRLGPILFPTSPKQSKQEQVNREFMSGVLEELEGSVPTLYFISCSTAYTDPRPSRWEGLDFEPLFTYQLDLTGRTRDDLLASFSKSLRREIRHGGETELSVDRRGVDEAKQVYETTRKRFEDQGLNLRISWEYMRDLLYSLDDRARVYTAEDPDGDFLGGITVLYADDTAYFWKGGTRSGYDGISVNSLIHWRILTDILEDPALESVGQYDLYTANNERLTRYKSKFGGSLEPYYRIESSSVPMTVAKALYRTVSFNPTLSKWV
jgi:hypothetical protein